MPLDWIRRVLGSSPASDAQVPPTADCDISRIKSEVVALVRSKEYFASYKQWQQTRACSSWLTFFKNQHDNYNCGCKLAPCDSRLAFNIAKCTRGFMLNFDENIHNSQDFQFLLDHFAAAFIDNGYTLKAADLRTYNCPLGKVETIERYYLKPSKTCLNEGKIEQCFGNITLTLHARSNVPMYLQCRAAHYRDMNMFQPSHSLSKLVECISK